MTNPRLPNELLAKIAEEVDSDQTLVALSTVSHAWYQHVQPLLYHSIWFLDIKRDVPFRLQVLLQTLRQTPKLGGVVREILLKRYWRNHVNSRQAFADLARVISLCPNLTRLHLEASTALLDWDLFRILEMCQSLEELAMNGCSSITAQGFRNVLPFLQHLKKLNVADCSGLDDDCIRDIARFCPLIQDLDLCKTSVTPIGVSLLLEGAVKLACLNLLRSWWMEDSDIEAIINDKPSHVQITHIDTAPATSHRQEHSDDSNDLP
ncbi:hypothetical protein DFS34DRAFT_667214 [Phlyctochytrium arcticum]|nr:hypothetical protein DFS34DRAFT_667214 [Phlyctochytrium arcticum]